MPETRHQTQVLSWMQLCGQYLEVELETPTLAKHEDSGMWETRQPGLHDDNDHIVDEDDHDADK